MNRIKYLFVFLLLVIYASKPFAQKTVVSIIGDKFYFNGKPTYENVNWKGNNMEGLLMNARMVQGVFDDLNTDISPEFQYPDTQKWDADRNNREFVKAMSEWKNHGLLAFTLNMQGGSPYGYGNKKCLNPGFNADGSLMKPYMDRLDNILKEADNLNMAVILGLFYFGQDQHLKDEKAIKNAVSNMTDWILKKGYRNVLLEISNESNHRSYDHAILHPDRIAELINLAKSKSKNGQRLLVSTSFTGLKVPNSEVVKASDFILIHGNGAKDPSQIQTLIDETRAVEGFRPMPIVNNEDDHFDFEKETNNMVVSIKNFVSWGYFDFRFKGETDIKEGYQTVPVNWGISSDRKKAFFNSLKEITSSIAPSHGLILENPITANYLKEHLSKVSPRLILNPALEKNLKSRLKTDPILQKYYANLKTESIEILKTPLPTKEVIGFRMLRLSQQEARRMGILGMVYRIEKNPEILKRINAELLALSAFDNWNPQHYLDVAEMSFAVSLALDWVGEYLPKETIKTAKLALIQKGILPSYNENGERMGWIKGINNWNTICHSGMIAASLTIADIDPELASATISRALNNITGSLKEYGPDGAFPEGPSYWEYGTSYGVVASNILKTALGSDFGIAASPGFMESAKFRLMATAPSGEYFNFADSDGFHGSRGAILLAWFAAMTGDAIYYDKPFFENNDITGGTMAGPGLVWLSQITESTKSTLPYSWMGRGANHVAIFRGDKEDTHQFFLAAKGGRAMISHGNMDAGSFVFDLNGVRWVLDPGNQSYYPLNEIGFRLSDYSQDSERWTLLTKGNNTHSTVTINGERFKSNASATITDFKLDKKPEVSIDMSPIYEGLVSSFQRKFIKENNTSILIEDSFEATEATKTIVWRIMTTAEVETTKNGAILRQDGKELKLSILAPLNLSISVVALNPPPLAIDKTIENLKSVEINIPAYILKDKKGTIQVRLSGE